MSNDQTCANAGVNVRHQRTSEQSRREFLELTLATAALAAPFTAGASVAGASVAGPSATGTSAGGAVASAAARVRGQSRSPADRLEEILGRYGSELGHVTSIGPPKQA